MTAPDDRASVFAVEQMRDPTPADRAVEVVERKGLGHPDTICDALAEEVSRTLSRHYRDRFGMVLHHNVDKALLCGGSANVRFGGGEVTAPIEIILAGRATTSFRGAEVPVAELAMGSCLAWLRANLHALDADRHVRIECRFRPGSDDLTALFAPGAGGRLPLANDTSIGVGYAPLSALEETVLDVERWLNGRELKRARPETGEDVKVMAVRNGEQTRLTIACAFVSGFVPSAEDYVAKHASLLDAIRGRVMARLGRNTDVMLNAADAPGEHRFYLTVTGTSAEAGDDGQVGRGNRVNGLITPGRPMSLEAAAGKNPVSHVGKLYNVTAAFIAQDLISTLANVAAAECVLVSRIGAPIDEPQSVGVRLRTTDGRPAAEHTSAVADAVRGRLRRLSTLSEQLIAGGVQVY